MIHRILLGICALAIVACLQSPQPSTENAPQSAIDVKSQKNTLALQPLSSGLSLADNGALAQAFAQKQSHVWLQGHGEVVKLLADDTQGARHQRFLLRVSADQTLLFAHNIDLAPRAEVNIGDQVQFKGEYIYNPKGGIMHWTHHDPSGKQGGWIQVNGQTYE